MAKSAESPKNSNESAAHQSGQESGGFAHELLDVKQSFLNAAIQQPLTGLTQIADGLLNKKWDPILFEAPKQAQFGLANPDWYAQQLGSSLGMVADFAALSAGLKRLPAFNSLAADEGAFSQKSLIGLSAKQAAITGFGYDALLMPSNYKQGDRASFLESRGLGGLKGAATFTAFSLSGMGINRLGETSAVERVGLSRLFKSRIGAGILSGIPGGLVSSEAGALSNKHAIPKLNDLYQNTLSFSIAGGIFGAKDALTTADAVGQSPTDRMTSNIQNHIDQVRARTNALFPQGLQPAYAAPGAEFRPLSVRVEASDLHPAAPSKMTETKDLPLSASQVTSGTERIESNIAPTDPADLRQSRIAELRALEPSLRSSGDHQELVHSAARAILNEEKQRGNIGPSWDIFLTQKGSPADLSGADMYMTDGSRLHTLDGTSNSDKMNDPAGHHVAALREGGLIYYEKGWFDQMGKLRTHESEPSSIREPVLDFQEGLRAQLIHLSHSPSYLSLTDSPYLSPMKLDTAAATAQIDQFSAWLKEKAAQSQDADEQQRLNDYAKTIDRGAKSYLEHTARTAESPVFTGKLEAGADKALVNLAVNSLLGRDTTVVQPKTVASDIYYHAESQHIKFEDDDGTIYDGGNVLRLLAARGRALNIESTLTVSQVKNLEKAYSGKDPVSLVASQIANMRGQINAGGALGQGRPVLVDSIVARLRAQNPDDLLGREHVPTSESPEVEIPAAMTSAAQAIAQAWHKEGLASIEPGEAVDPELLELVIEGAKTPAQDQSTLSDLLERYKNNDPQAVTALDQALQRR